MKNLRSIQSSIIRSSKELLFLTQQCIKHKPTSRIGLRQMLLDTQEKQTAPSGSSSNLVSSGSNSSSHGNSNGITLNLLKLDKELNLVQYHGIQTYLSKYWIPSTLKRPNMLSWFSNSSTNPYSDKTDQEQNNILSQSTSNQTKATVAFMITSQQRQILMSDQFEYTKEQIKSMKPNEAQVILQHSIHSSKTGSNGQYWKDIVNDILMEEEKEAQFQQQQQKQKQEQELMIKKEEEEKEQNRLIPDDDAHDDILSLGFEEKRSIVGDEYHPYSKNANERDSGDCDQPPSLLLSQGNFTDEQKASTSTANKNCTNANNDFNQKQNNIWYEVVESSSKVAIGLCKTRKEAEELLQIKQDLAMKQKKSPTASLTSIQQHSDENTFHIRIRNI